MATKKSGPANSGQGPPDTPHVPEASFDDAIAHNRAVKIIDAATVPQPPAAYRPTDPEVRNRRLRKMAGELRAEAMEALREAAHNDLQDDLGKYAPDPKRAHALAERLTHSGKLVVAVQTLLGYAKEEDQIAMSDAVLFLEAELKQYEHAVDHEPSLAPRYQALVTLFEARNEAIAEGRARAAKEAAPAGEKGKGKVQAEPDAQPAEDAPTK